MLFALMPLSDSTHWVAAQDSKQLRSIREAFAVVPARYGCCPVEVTGIALTGYPLEVILGQAMVENRSGKTVVALRLGWRVDAHWIGIVRDFSQCAIPPTNKAFLSGNTPLISMGELAPKETSNIGPNPLISDLGATGTVFIDYPIISANDVKSLPLDETRKRPKYSICLICLGNSLRGWYELDF
jgi:hypothetical protein